MPAELNPTPVSLLKQAIKAVPAVKYALGVGGIIAVVVIVAGFKIDFRIAVFGVVIMFVLMTVLVVFARLSVESKSSFHAPAVAFTWFAVLLTMATALALFTSVFVGAPLDLRDLIRTTHPNNRNPYQAGETEKPQTNSQTIPMPKAVDQKDDNTARATSEPVTTSNKSEPFINRSLQSGQSSAVRVDTSIVFSGTHILTPESIGLNLDTGQTGLGIDMTYDHGMVMPVNDAKLAELKNVDFETVDAEKLAQFSYETNNALIDGAKDAGNELKEGTVFGMLTTRKNYAVVQVLTYSHNSLKIRWKTFRPPQ